MKKYIIYLLLFILPFGSFSQTWILSNQLECDDDLRILDVKKDQNDNFYAAGIYKGTFNGEVSEGNYDIFIAKLNDSFNIEWVKSIGSSNTEFDPRITMDNDNNLFLVGAFQDSCVFDDQYLKSEGNYDIFLAKYTNSGKLIWTKNIAKYPTQQNPTDIDTDNDNNLIITGHYTDSISVDGQNIISSGKNNFYTKFDTSGVGLWTENISGSSAASRITNVKVYQNEYYFNGNFRDQLNFDIETINSNVAGKQDLFLYKTDKDGNGLWVRRTYGDNLDATGSIAGDNYGNVYFTGYFQSTTLTADFNATTISNQSLNHVNDFDIFVLKYNKSGILQLIKQFGGNGRDYGVDLNVNNDILYMSGYFSDAIDFGDQTLTSAGTADRDMFFAAFDLNANPYNSISLGGTDNNDIAAGAIVLNSGDAVMAGYFQSSSILVGATTYTNTSPGLRDGIVAKYSAPFSVVFSDITEISCNSDANGELIVTPEFGVKPYSYSWSHDGALNDSTASNLGAGTYTVTVTDGNSDTDEVTYTLVEPDAITFNPTISNIIACSYSQEGAIDLNMSGGTGSFTYKWQASNGGYGTVFNIQDQSNLTIGTYTVSVTDANKCAADTTIVLAGPNPITFANTAVIDSSSAGAGEIDLQIQGGSGSKNYSWEYPDGSTASTQDIVNLKTGNYTVTVTDGNLCKFDTLINVKNLDDFYIYITDFKDACKGTIQGRAKVSYHSPDGHTNITYLWDDAASQTTAEAINLAPGRYYRVTVTDVDSDPDEVRTDSVFIDNLNYDFTGSLSGTSVLNCFGDTDGYIDLSITSPGILPLSYSWSTGSTLQDVINLGIGSYNVTVTDKNSCAFSITNYVITQPTALAISAEIVNEPSCNGDFDGEVTVDRTGGTSPYSYQWDDPGFQNTRNADGLDAGFYTVTVTDNNSCMASSSITLTEPDEISVSKVISNETCNTSNDGYVSLTVSGGTSPFSYFWSTTTGTGLNVTNKDQSGLSAGKYYFTITDDNNCTYEDSVEITEPSLLEITNETNTNITTCYGDNSGTITITATGGTGDLTYILNPGAIQTNTTGVFTALRAGTYTVYVEDENGCNVTSNSISITQPTELVLTTNSEIDAKCHGIDDGSVAISVTGGTVASAYTYTWTTSDGSGIILGAEDQPTLGAGTYNLTVSDDNSCEATGSYTLEEPDTINVSRTKYDLLCNGDNDGGVTLTVSGGVSPYSYVWSTIDGSGITIPDKNQTGLSAGMYYYTIRDDNSCLYEDSVEIIEPVVIEITLEEAIDGTSCGGGTTGEINVHAIGGTGVLNYTLNPGATQTNTTGSFTAIGTGNYTVEVEDENRCKLSSSTLSVLEPEAIVITTDNKRNASCFGTENGIIEISVNGGTRATDYSYTWSTTDGSGVIDGQQDQLTIGAGTYYLTVTDDNDCEGSANFSITEPDSVIIEKTVYQPFCVGTSDGVVVLSIAGGALPFSYFWSTVDGSGLVPTNKHQSNLSPGMYYIQLDDANGCIYHDSVELIEPPVIEILTELSTDATDNNSRDGSVTITASGGTPPLTYTLNPGGELNYTGIFDDLNPGEYTVDVSDFNECDPVSSSILTVGSINSISEILLGESVYIYPNPTSSDLYVVFESGSNDDYMMQIVNISGQVVYASEFNSNDERKQILDVSRFAKGFYFIRIYNNIGSYQKKILIQ